MHLPVKANSYVTKAGAWLFCVSFGFTFLVGCVTQDWALTTPEGGLISEQRSVWPLALVYLLLLFGVWALAYFIGWLGLRALGIRVTKSSPETA